MGFGKVSKEVMTDPSISPGAKSLYSLLCCYMDKSRSCYPGIKRLSEELYVTPSTIKRWMNELKKAKIISRTQEDKTKTAVTFILK